MRHLGCSVGLVLGKAGTSEAVALSSVGHSRPQTQGFQPHGDSHAGSQVFYYSA